MNRVGCSPTAERGGHPNDRIGGVRLNAAVPHRPMHSTSSLLRALAHLCVAITLTFAGFMAAPSARAQVFLAEIVENDIGRIGPTGMALDTIAGVTYLY